MDFAIPRREPRFELGIHITVAVQRGAGWRELPAFTVNVSHHGLLVTLNDPPQLGEHVRVKFPPPGEGWGEAVVRHVVRGSANYLVGVKLREPYDGWPKPEEPQPSEGQAPE